MSEHAMDETITLTFTPKEVEALGEILLAHAIDCQQQPDSPERKRHALVMIGMLIKIIQRGEQKLTAFNN